MDNIDILVVSIDENNMDRNKKSIRLYTRFFIAKYGSKILRMLLTGLLKGYYGQSIAEEFNLTRMDIQGFTSVFGTTKTTYTLFLEAEGTVTKDKREGKRKIY